MRNGELKGCLKWKIEVSRRLLCFCEVVKFRVDIGEGFIGSDVRGGSEKFVDCLDFKIYL